MSPRRSPGRPRRLVVKRRYARFYALSVLYGARKQLFITFGPWMLVDLFRQPVADDDPALPRHLVVGIGALPLVGRLTDRFGPRAVLGGEALLTIAVCARSTPSLPSSCRAGAALVVVSACYVVDQAANAVSMTRAVFVSQIAETGPTSRRPCPWASASTTSSRCSCPCSAASRGGARASAATAGSSWAEPSWRRSISSLRGGCRRGE